MTTAADLRRRLARDVADRHARLAGLWLAVVSGSTVEDRAAVRQRHGAYRPVAC